MYALLIKHVQYIFYIFSSAPSFDNNLFFYLKLNIYVYIYILKLKLLLFKLVKFNTWFEKNVIHLDIH